MRVRIMMFNATFNNISVISWRSVLLVEDTRVPRENQQPDASHWQTLSHNVVLSTPRQRGICTHNVLLNEVLLPGIGIAAKCVASVDLNDSRCCWRARLELLCCTASISNLSMACFIFSMCLLKIAFCSSSSVACLLNCRNSPSLAEIIKIWNYYKMKI